MSCVSNGLSLSIDKVFELNSYHCCNGITSFEMIHRSIFLLSVDSCIKKWSNIREFYKKCKNHNKFGAGSTTKGKIRLQHLSFLDGVAVNIRE